MTLSINPGRNRYRPHYYRDKYAKMDTDEGVEAFNRTMEWWAEPDHMWNDLYALKCQTPERFYAIPVPVGEYPETDWAKTFKQRSGSQWAKQQRMERDARVAKFEVHELAACIENYKKYAERRGLNKQHVGAVIAYLDAELKSAMDMST